MALPVCYATCGTAWAACYAGASLVAGTIASLSAPAAALACNKVQGTCMAACYGPVSTAWVTNPVALVTMATLGIAFKQFKLKQ